MIEKVPKPAVKNARYPFLFILFKKHDSYNRLYSGSRIDFKTLGKNPLGIKSNTSFVIDVEFRFFEKKETNKKIPTFLSRR